MNNKMRNLDLESCVDNFLAENSALRRKLQSKGEALIILSKDLDKCRTERDQFQLMAEQLQDRYSILKKKTHDLGFYKTNVYSDGLNEDTFGSTLISQLNETKEKNKALRIEVEDLKQKLIDAQGDIKVLRLKLNQQKTFLPEDSSFPIHQREELVHNLETLNQKYLQIQIDLQTVLDEKEELVVERDAYKYKVHRLNHELNNLLKSDGKQIMDIDGLIMENRYLQERLQQVEEEKDLSNQSLLKYKNMLDKKRNKGIVKLGTNNSSMIISHKQVQQLLEKGTSTQLPNTIATLADMRSLCLALLEALGDKSLAFSHQKKANKILANRIEELEKKLEEVQGIKVVAFPSQLFLESYSSSDINNIKDDLFEVKKDFNQKSECDKDSSSENNNSDLYNNLVEENINICEMSIFNQDPNLDIEPLPPNLNLLVQQALEDIKQEAKTNQ